MASQHVVIWGAGRIGRGFAGDLFAGAGYHITFVDQNIELVEHLRGAGHYTVACTPSGGARTDRMVAGYRALWTGESEDVTAAVAQAEAAVVAVFPGDFAAVAQDLAPGIRRRLATDGPMLDILMCTNMAHAAAEFRGLLEAVLPDTPPAQLAARLGVVDTLVMRMVADAPAEEQARDALLVWTNGTAEFPIDRRALRGPVPPVPGMRLVDDMAAEELRKLYTYNMCHALLAYLGALRGYTMTVDCLADAAIREAAEGALDEVGRALERECGFTQAEMAGWAARVVAQTANPALRDRVARHGADPRRKLRRSDRLVGPALLARQHGIRPGYLAQGIAAGLLFREPGDAGAAYVQEQLERLGAPVAVRKVCQLAPEEDELAELILQAYHRLHP